MLPPPNIKTPTCCGYSKHIDMLYSGNERREGNRHLRSKSLFARNRYSATMMSHDAAHDRESQPHTFLLRAVKRPANARHLFFAHADTRIRHFYPHRSIWQGNEIDGDHAPPRHRIKSIGDEIDQELRHLIWITAKLDIC